MRRIAAEPAGVVVYLHQSGWGEKKHAPMPDGSPRPLHEFGIGAQILHDLGVRQIRLLTNNPRKVIGLDGYGLKIVERVPIQMEAGEHNREYLETKRSKLGHILT